MLDPTIVALAKAIRDQESGNNFNARGGDGEMGAYQFMPDTWKAWAGEHLGNPRAEMTRANQNKVAYKQIEKWKKQGLNVGQIASAWNAGLGNKDAYLGTHKGISKGGVAYDTPAYAREIAARYKLYKQNAGLVDQSPQTLASRGIPNPVTGQVYPAPPKPPVPSRFESFATGVAKGELSTLKGLGTLGQKVLDNTINKIFPGANAGSDIYRPNTLLGQQATSALQGKNTFEKIGKGVEQTAEFFVPSGLASKGERAVDLLSKGIKSPLLAATARIAGKSTVQGAAAGATRFIQTGGDVKESAKTAATAGVARSVFATIGEGARALRIPERLYSTIFKNSKNDMIAELRANGIANLRQTNPQKYQELVDNGLIKTGVGGNPIINETLAEKALDRGLRGSIPDMANEVVYKTLDTENKLQRAVAAHKGTVSITEPQYKNVLTKIATEYEDVGFGEISKEANGYINDLTATKGQVSAKTALNIRRFLDKMRIASSYDRPATSLSLTQSNFKTLADNLRGRINKIPGVAALMKDYSFYIDAIDAIAKEAARRGNNQALGLIDSVFLGGGIAGNPIVGAGGFAFRKFLSSPRGTTGLGSVIKNPNLGSKASFLLQTGSAGVQSRQKGQ